MNPFKIIDLGGVLSFTLISYRKDLDILPLQTRRQTLRQLLSLLRILYHQGVQETRATNLELGLVGALADFDELSVLAASLLEKVADVGDLLGHFEV